jgi:hypothetical protein
MTRGRRPTLALALGCAASLAALLGGAWALRRPLRAWGEEWIWVDRDTLPALERWQRRPQHRPGVDALLLGDSLSACRPSVRVSAELAAALAARGVAGSVHRVAHPGFRPLHYYYLLDDILGGRPGLVVIQINLRWYSPFFIEGEGARFRNLSRKLDLRRALRIADGLSEENLTLLDPWLYRLEDAVGLLYVPAGVRLLTGTTLEGLGDALVRTAGLRGSNPWVRTLRQSRWQPMTRERVRREYGGDWIGQSSTRILREIVSTLHEERVAVLLYVSPVNVERLRSALDAPDDLALPERIEALRTAVGARPAEWLDLHALLSREAFADNLNHMRADGCARVAGALADRLGGRAGVWTP